MLPRYEKWPNGFQHQSKHRRQWNRELCLFFNDKDPSSISEVDAVNQADGWNKVAIPGVLRVEQI